MKLFKSKDMIALFQPIFKSKDIIFEVFQQMRIEKLSVKKKHEEEFATNPKVSHNLNTD